MIKYYKIPCREDSEYYDLLKVNFNFSERNDGWSIYVKRTEKLIKQTYSNIIPLIRDKDSNDINSYTSNIISLLLNGMSQFLNISNVEIIAKILCDDEIKDLDHIG